MVKLLILADHTRRAIEYSQWLCANDYEVTVVADKESALGFLQHNEVDVILIMDDLSRASCLDACKSYRQAGGQAFILMVDLNQDKCNRAERALDAGADDFVANECQLSELSARIRALLRRPPRVLDTLLRAGPILMDPSTRRVLKDEVEIRLQPMEWHLLEFFLRHPNQVFSARTLHMRIWREPISSTATTTTCDTVRTHIKTLRKKIDDDSQESLIKNVHGRGYKLQA
jgi:DNA-binding response OmpR family regulator